MEFLTGTGPAGAVGMFADGAQSYEWAAARFKGGEVQLENVSIKFDGLGRAG